MRTAREYAHDIWSENEGCLVNGWDEVERVIAAAMAEARAAALKEAAHVASESVQTCLGSMALAQHGGDARMEAIASAGGEEASHIEGRIRSLMLSKGDGGL